MADQDGGITQACEGCDGLEEGRCHGGARRAVSGGREGGRRGDRAVGSGGIVGIIDNDLLSKCEKKCKILGIDTEWPIMQLDSYVFAGEYEDAVGTCVIFEEDTDHDKERGGEIIQYCTSQGIPPGTVVLPTGTHVPNQSFMHVDAEGNSKPMLKYKCHTVKKLSMTRNLLTEKKEGEENIGDVEWLQMKDYQFSCRPNTICSFLHENENENEHEDEQAVVPTPPKPVEMEEQEIQEKDNSSLLYEQEELPDLEIEDPEHVIVIPSSETEGCIFMGTQDSDLEITPR